MKKIYLLLMFVVLAGVGFGQIISQYVETSSGTTPKGIEIWNNTGSSLDFSTNNLVIKKGINGGAPSTDFTLSSGSLASGEVIVIGTSDMEATTTGNGAVFHLKAFTFNGDDALEVWYGAGKTDVFGNPGSDPGSAWTGNGVSTANQNIQLKTGITIGDTDGWTDPSLRFETVCTDNCITGFGLASSSSTPTITLSTSALTGFSYTVGSGPSAEQTFTAEGTNLTHDITLTAPTNYEISETSGSGYTSPITLTQSGGSVATTTIYTRLKAGLGVGDYNSEDITAASTGATSQTVICSGTVYKAEPTNHVTGFASGTTTSTSIPLSWTENDGAVVPDGYLIKANTGVVVDPADGTDPADDTDLTDGSGNVKVAHGSTNYTFANCSSTTTYNFKIYPYTNTGANIDFKIASAPSASGHTIDENTEVYAPVTQIAATNISSLHDTQGEADQVFKITIEDQGSGDGLATKVTNIRVKPHTTNTADWTDAIQGVFVYDGGNYVYPTSTSITDTYIDLAFGSSDLNVSDGGSMDVTLYVYLNTSNIVDGHILSFMVDADDYGFTADASGSGFATTFSGGDFNSNNFTIDVDASQLTFKQQPSSVNVDVVMSPSPQVAFTDANGNTDTDYNGAGYGINLTTTGTFSGTATTAVDATSGISIFDNIIFSVAGSGVTITANDEDGWGNASATSDAFDVNDLPNVFFSEYIEGSSSNKAIEIYNGESTSIDLSEYTVNLYSNGASSPSSTWTGSTTLASNEVYVIYNSSAGAIITAKGDEIAAVANFNGNDALELVHNSTSLDIIGVIGTDPGTAWDVAGTTNATVNHTLVRKLSISDGNTDWSSSAGTTTVNSEWIVFSVDHFYNLGVFGTGWSGATDTDWSVSGNWDVQVPVSTTNVLINSSASTDPLISGDATTPSESKNVLIESGASVTIPALKALTVSGTLSNSGTFNINATSSGTGSLIHQTADVEATVEQYIAEDNNWHFLCVPFTGTMPEICDGNYAPTTGNFDATVGATYDFYYLDEAVADYNWINLKESGWGVNTTNFGSPPRFVEGKGYLVAYSSSFAGIETKSATANLNTGSVDIAITATNLTYNLVGNPYPSSIDWKASSGWTRTDLGEYDGYNIWIWNGTAGQFGAYNSSSGSDDGTNGVSRYIAPGQGFYVKASSTGNLGMTNDVRVHSSKSLLKNIESATDFRLSVTGDQNTYSDEIIIEFGHDSDNGGAEKLYSMYPEAPSLATIKNDALYSLDFRGEPTSQTLIPVNFESGVSGIFTFIAEINSNVESILLEDLLLNKKVELNSNPEYVFVSSIDDDPDRFILHFSPVGINESDLQKNHIKIWSSNNTIQIINNENLKGNIDVVNLFGQVIANYRLVSDTKQQINFDAPAGLYIVNVKTEDGYMISKKVIIQ